MSTKQKHKCEILAALHQSDQAWVIPNPWDLGSAKLLEAMGFKALATTSAGYALTLGKQDGEISLADKLLHCSQLSEGTNVPISVDFENGFSDELQGLLDNLHQLIDTGVAGCSIEDFSRDQQEIYDIDIAVARIEACCSAVAKLDMPFQICARAENHIRGRDDFEDTLKRLQAYASAGADIVYAPGIASLDQITAISEATHAPQNVLAPFFATASVNDLGAAGATRISLGNALNTATVKPLFDAAQEMLNQGTFTWTRNMASGAKISELLGAANKLD